MIELDTKELRSRFREAIQSMTECYPEWAIIDSYLDTDCHKLQDFCSTYCDYTWMTGMGVIEAAMVLVDGAAENGNIDDEGRVV